jgi:hypothetical protein
MSAATSVHAVDDRHEVGAPERKLDWSASAGAAAAVFRRKAGRRPIAIAPVRYRGRVAGVRDVVDGAQNE